MEYRSSLLKCLWAACFATGLGIRLTTPSRYLVSTFLCGFAGRLMRDLCMGVGLNQNWSTLIAATAVVVVAVATLRRHSVSPVVLICGVLPLGASVATFNFIFDLMRVSSLQGEGLAEASVSLTGNLGKVFVTTLTLALGIAAGLIIVRLFRRDETVEV